MDISGIQPGERFIEITHPGNGRNIGVRVSIMSINDERMKPLKKQITNERLRLEARGKNFKADDIEDNANELTFKAMTGWQWYKINADGKEDEKGEQATFNGKVPDFNRASVISVFTKLPWLRNQIDEAISEEKDFFTASAPN
ncbi:hypothetical protein [Mesorhizobium sp. M1A.F.Ca.ET.072.01.1.1]|uniref:hypothetical protein n=1 Tax=Mesorhizobium sp. M1A.F.Ca.ET.072.01.1.1 TaxID=2496753 RepID=UPI000FEBD1DA|nr:hypothetical protein [Mesorhizobium sp. M1A.F.Ca.ET.072.01.1.1]